MLLSLQNLMKKKLFDPIFESGKRESDLRSLPFQRVTQLYSRNSGNHIQILPNRKIDAQGEDGSEYGKILELTYL